MSALRPSSDGHVIHYERIKSGPYFADFRRDRRLYPEVYHCIVQRENSSEIISWSQFRTLERAMSAANRELKRLMEGAKGNAPETQAGVTLPANSDTKPSS